MSVGDVVLYHDGDGQTTYPAVVVRVADHDGDLDLRWGPDDVLALDVKEGDGPHTWERLRQPD